LKKHNKSRKKSEHPSKRAKSRGPVQRDAKEVLAELMGKLKEKLDPKKAAATSAGEEHPRGELGPNLDRLTVGVELGEQWSQYCILGLEGETLAEGQLRTTPQDICRILSGMECGTSGFRGGDTLGMGAGSDLRLRTRSAGGQPAIDGRVETAQAEE
jgi:hypothetical protein